MEQSDPQIVIREIIVYVQKPRPYTPSAKEAQQRYRQTPNGKERARVARLAYYYREKAKRAEAAALAVSEASQ